MPWLLSLYSTGPQSTIRLATHPAIATAPNPLLLLKKDSDSALIVLREKTHLVEKKAPIYFFEDQGLASHLLQSIDVQPYPLLNLIRGLYANILPQFHYRPELNSQITKEIIPGMDHFIGDPISIWCIWIPAIYDIFENPARSN